MTIQPSGRGPQVIAVYSFFAALTTVAIALRTYCRAILLKNFALDDYLAITSWFLFIILCAFAITGTYHGTGQHADKIKPVTEIPVGLKWWWRCEPVYVISNMAIKASIAVMLLRLTIIKIHRIIIWINIVVLEIYSTCFFFLFIFQCSPSSYFWTQYTGGKGSCINPTALVNVTYGYSAITCVSDWIFAILPFFLVWKLQMKPRAKLLVALILAMGAIASTATIIRIPYLTSLSNKSDFLYATTDVAIWSCCESGLAITAASAATLRPIFHNFISRSKLFGNTTAPRRQENTWIGQRGYGGGYVRNHHSAAGIDELGFADRMNKSANSEVIADPYAIPNSPESRSSETRMIGKMHVVNLMRG